MPYFAIYTFLPYILSIMGLKEGFGTDFLLNVILIIGAVLGIWFTIIFSPPETKYLSLNDASKTDG